MGPFSFPEEEEEFFWEFNDKAPEEEDEDYETWLQGEVEFWGYNRM